jgi:hypothetical protein
MVPSASTDTSNRTFGTVRDERRRKNVVMFCLLGSIIYSLVSNSYSSMPNQVIVASTHTHTHTHTDHCEGDCSQAYLSGGFLGGDR